MLFLNENRHLYEGLTRHNYFPNQKDSIGEIPPCFSTRQFTPEIVELLIGIDESKDRKKLGYDQVEYLATRHDNVPRSLGLIHPKAYAYLAKTIYDNWDKLKQVTDNGNSMIKPDMHTDGRIMIMNYEDITDKTRQALNDGFGKRFRVHSDISSCFHSIYTHSIPWATIGFDKAKSKFSENKRGKTTWFDDLDKSLRRTKRNETQGIAIGPATSSIVVEHILGAVDKVLTGKGFKFRRYIDDYACYCETYESAQQFIQVLSKELRVYKLNINLHKTKIIDLPETLNDDWVSVLAGALPTNYIDEKYTRRKLIESEIIHYLDTAVRLNKSTPDGSVIKYAVSSVVYQINDSAIESVLDYVINLSWHYPVLLPYLDILFSSEYIEPEKYTQQLNSIIAENARNGRSDGMAWPLYFLKKYSLPVSNKAFAETLRAKDCLSLLCLYATGTMVEHIVDFAYDLFCKTDYEKDQYWLLLYQLFRDGVIKSPYDDGVFEMLNEYGVNFMPAHDEYNSAEKYCNYLYNPFAKPEEKSTPFKDWVKELQ
ncbi:MAG: RNA-directed DNA polymerase [Gammaproteobacteria bacterium]|nr:RNA-directed DNA polymerase [Gammaproteobacteria bacterium]